jgi:hypothetical protein
VSGNCAVRCRDAGQIAGTEAVELCESCVADRRWNVVDDKEVPPSLAVRHSVLVPGTVRWMGLVLRMKESAGVPITLSTPRVGDGCARTARLVADGKFRRRAATANVDWGQAQLHWTHDTEQVEISTSTWSFE